MKIAFLTTDNREQHGRYELSAPYFGTAMEALLQGFALLRGEVEIHVISCAKKQMDVPIKLSDNIFFHQPIVRHAGWGRTAFLGCALAVRQVLQAIQPDLVHAQGTERDCGVSMMLASHVPRILTIHGHMARIAEITGARFPSYYWLATFLEAAAVRRAEGVVALTGYTRDRVAASAARTWVLPNAVDMSFYNVENVPKPGLALCVAGVGLWKRQVELIEAMDLLEPSRRPNLVFIGGASDSAYVDAFKAAVAQRSSWCNYIGPLGREDLRQWLAKASMLILPSIEDNCPMVILEAMAAGIPVAASRIGGIPDLVTEDVTGKLFDPRQPAQIANAVEAILANDELANQMRRNARNHALKHFHPEVIARGHLALYREIIADYSVHGHRIY